MSAPATFAYTEIARLRRALEAVPDAYERKVSAALDSTLPDHSEGCDRNWTSGACLRCLVISHVNVAYGFARPLGASSGGEA